MAPTRDDRDNLPIFRPRLGRGARRDVREPTLRNALLRGLRRGAASPRAKASGATAGHGANARRVVIKAHVARLTARGAKAAALHLRYIQRDGVERDGSKGILYDAQGPVRPEAFEGPRPGENHQFRLIISPEDASELDLTAFVRRLMARVEADIGRTLEWAAVDHHNTDHPHAHVVIRGVARDGREVRLDRAYISSGMRWRAQEIATEELGPRHELDIRRALGKELTQDRFTSLDRELARRIDGDRVRVGRLGSEGAVDESLLVGRLEHLETVRLAERMSRTEWALAPGWQQSLREWGARGDIIKQIHAAISGDPARYHVASRRAAARTGSSRRRPASSRGGSPTRACLTNSAAPVTRSSRRRRGTPTMCRSTRGPPRSSGVGDWVSFTTKPEAAVRPVDRHIAEVARARQDVYELEPSAGDAATVERTQRRLATTRAAWCGHDRRAE